MRKTFLIFGLVGCLGIINCYADDVVSPETMEVDMSVVRAARGTPKVNTVNPVKPLPVEQTEQNTDNIDMVGQNAADGAGLRCRDKDCTVVCDYAGCLCRDKRGIVCPMGQPVSAANVVSGLDNQEIDVSIDETEQENLDMLSWSELNRRYCPRGCHVYREKGTLILPIKCVDRRGNDCGTLSQTASTPSADRAAIAMPTVVKPVDSEEIVNEDVDF